MSLYDDLKNVIEGKSESEVRILKSEYFNRICVTRVRFMMSENSNLDVVTNRLIDLIQNTFLDLYDHSIALDVARSVMLDFN